MSSDGAATTQNGDGDGKHAGAEKTGDLGDTVHVSGHPVLLHKITILRSIMTPPGKFRGVLREVTYNLAYEATSRLTTAPIAITVPVPGKNGVEHMEWPNGNKLVERNVALIPILRSGLGMVDAMLELLPNAAIHHIGMYRVRGQNPVQYFNRLPRKCSSDVAYVLDPVIQTSATLMSVIAILKKWGAPKINVLSVVASRQGLKQLVDAHPDIHFTVGIIDELNEEGVVLPGLGDAGDRQFGTAPMDPDDDEALLHPSKRKRTMD